MCFEVFLEMSNELDGFSVIIEFLVFYLCTWVFLLAAFKEFRRIHIVIEFEDPALAMIFDEFYFVEKHLLESD